MHGPTCTFGANLTPLSLQNPAVIATMRHMFSTVCRRPPHTKFTPNSHQIHTKCTDNALAFPQVPAIGVFCSLLVLLVYPAKDDRAFHAAVRRRPPPSLSPYATTQIYSTQWSAVARPPRYPLNLCPPAGAGGDRRAPRRAAVRGPGL